MCLKRLKYLKLGTKMYTRSFYENLIIKQESNGNWTQRNKTLDSKLPTTGSSSDLKKTANIEPKVAQI